MKKRMMVSVLFFAALNVLASDQNLVSVKVEKMTLDPNDAAWKSAPEVSIALTPQKLLLPQPAPWCSRRRIGNIIVIGRFQVTTIPYHKIVPAWLCL